jgi:hypothetical protein
MLLELERRWTFDMCKRPAAIAKSPDSGCYAIPEQPATPREVTALGTMIPQCPSDKPGR